ncbi:MAG: hypothetical protein M3R53_06550 [Candidatus Eremiobacteraeota bacterium]|nr:hypothetical protein [Candidatus Eremiobacteraeota bacterium]
MTRAVRGTVINIHELGATVRLVDGTLAAVAARELASNRPAYIKSRDGRTELEFSLDVRGRHAVLSLSQPRVAEAPAPEPVASLTTDIAFEEQIEAYLKETQEWAPVDRPEPSERHFIRKKRRAALFEARKRPT